VIDEISMVRADMMDCIDIFLQNALGNKMPFGGVQMIFVGDLFQLPPILSYSDKAMFSSVYKAPYFFAARVFNRPDMNFATIELEAVHRQSDPKFVEILNAIRNKTVKSDHLTDLNKCVNSDRKISNGTMYITTKNDKVDEINQQQLAKIK
jgi:ATP-dependent DNA helicase PIF1